MCTHSSWTADIYRPRSILAVTRPLYVSCCVSTCVQVYASGTGNKRHPLFFLEWMWRSNGRKQPARKHRASKDLNLPTIKSPIKQALQLPPAASLPGVVTVPASSPPPSPVLVKPGALPLVDASSIAAAGCEWQEPADVAAERRKVEAMQDYADHPIVVKHLQKTYPSRDGQPPKVGRGCMCVFVCQRHKQASNSMLCRQIQDGFVIEPVCTSLNVVSLLQLCSFESFRDTAAAPV